MKMPRWPAMKIPRWMMTERGQQIAYVAMLVLNLLIWAGGFSALPMLNVLAVGFLANAIIATRSHHRLMSVIEDQQAVLASAMAAFQDLTSIKTEEIAEHFNRLQIDRDDAPKAPTKH